MQSDLELFGLLCCTDRNSSSASQLIVEYANWYVPVTLVTASVSVLLSIVVFIVHGFVRYRRSIQVADNIASRAESAPPSTRYSAAESNSHSLDVVSLLRSDSVEALADSRHVVPISIIRILQHSQRDKEVVKRCNETKSLLLYLFACDLLGCFFTALRSTLWISRVFNVDFATDNMIAHVVCSSGTVLIMTFYSCSMFWTIAFSYDVKRCWDNKESLTKVYHLVCWSLAIILGSLSEFSIYLPQFTSLQALSISRSPMKSNRGTSPPAGTWRLARYGYSYGPPQAQAQQPPPPPGVGNISDRSAQPVTSAPQFSVEALRLRDLQTDIRQDVVRNHLIATIGKGEADKLERAIDDFKKSAADDPKSLLPKAEIILQYLIMRDELFSHMQNSDLDGLLDICLRLEAEEMRLFKELLTAELMHARKAITVLKRKSMMPNTLTFDDRTMRELRRYNNPPKIMRDVIAATFLLLGECEDYTADWSHAREMLNPFGKSTGYLAGNRRIKDRFDDFDPLAIPPEIGARARELLDAYTLSNVYEVSECCATFYVWCKAALDAAAQHIGNAKPASSVRQRELLGMSSFPTSRGSPRGGTGRIYQRPRGAFSPNQNMEARLPALKTRGSYPSTQFMFTGGLARR